MQSQVRQVQVRTLQAEGARMMAANRANHRQVMRQWLYDQAADFDVAVCLCFPAEMKQVESGYDDRWAQLHISRFFNRIDRRLFKNEHKRKGKRIERLVVLEHAPTVGWHAHIALPCPSGWTSVSFANLLRREWFDEIKRHARGLNIETYCWVKPIEGHYADYTLKWISPHLNDEKVDELSRCARFDELNSHFLNDHIIPDEGRQAL